MSTEIVKPSGIIRNMEDAERAAAAMAASGFFQDARQAAQAVVKILAGQELGFGPFAAMTGVYIIQGRPAISANLMAAAVKRSGRYNFRVSELTDSRCEIAFYEGGQEVGRSVFTADDAKRAGTKNMDRYARNMLFARAISNGVRWYCPDVLGGGPVYTPEELGAEVNAEGELLAQARANDRALPAPTVTVEQAAALLYGDEQPTPATEPAPAPAVPGDVTEVALAPTPAPTQNGAREWSFPVLQAILKAQLSDSTISAKKALALSNLSADVTPDQAVAWMRVYRAARDEGSNPQDAAAKANAV